MFNIDIEGKKFEITKHQKLDIESYLRGTLLNFRESIPDVLNIICSVYSARMSRVSVVLKNNRLHVKTTFIGDSSVSRGGKFQLYTIVPFNINQGLEWEFKKSNFVIDTTTAYETPVNLIENIYNVWPKLFGKIPNGLDVSRLVKAYDLFNFSSEKSSCVTNGLLYRFWTDSVDGFNIIKAQDGFNFYCREKLNGIKNKFNKKMYEKQIHQVRTIFSSINKSQISWSEEDIIELWRESVVKNVIES